MRDTRAPRRRAMMIALTFAFGWLVLQNTTLLALFVWVWSHATLPADGLLLRLGSLLAAAAATVASAMLVGAGLAVAVARGRAAARAGRIGVRHV